MSNVNQQDRREIVTRNLTSLAAPERTFVVIGLLIAFGGLVLNAGNSFGWWQRIKMTAEIPVVQDVRLATHSPSAADESKK